MSDEDRGGQSGPAGQGEQGPAGQGEQGPAGQGEQGPAGGREQDEARRGEQPAQDATASALARARAVARSKGLRPGTKPARRRPKDLPPDVRQQDGRDFHLLGDEVASFIAERGWGVDVAAGSVLGRWPQIVGPEVAQHCAPVSFERGVLVVRAESTAWATQLRLLASSLLARLDAEAGGGVVTELKVVGPSAPSWSRGPRRISDGRGPRDTYG